MAHSGWRRSDRVAIIPECVQRVSGIAQFGADMSYVINTVEHRIRGGEGDPAGIVFYPRYFEMFDNCTTSMFSAATGLNKYQMFETYRFAGYPMVDTRARFLVPCRFGDDVTIETKMAEGHRPSFQVAQ